MKTIFTGLWGKCHIQGIAIDKKNGFIYYSFTTKLVKAKMNGEIVGSVDGLLGHLGCIAFCESDGRVYGSLEYKNDSIGKGILRAVNSSDTLSNAFYIARFDVDKIDRLDMSAEESGIMQCIYLDEVVKDYLGSGKNASGDTVPHKYGCSGIDGTTFAPLPQKSVGDGLYLYVSYGVYSDNDRNDNDYQVILCYDTKDWDRYAAPLNQSNMHTKGPDAPLHKYFVYTGNTTFGVQNLEYDAYKNAIFMAVYKGKKPNFPNYSLFAVDMSVAAEKKQLSGLDETGELLSLMPLELEADGICGSYFPYGSTGMFSYGDGRWMFSQNRVQNGEQCSDIVAYRWNGRGSFETEE